jgi:RimJ/RimL family protein N-acetyltransferase
MIVLETERLTLRHLCEDDASFILMLLNEPSFLQFIGDKGVRTLEDARNYILTGPMEMYARLGFGLYLVELKDGQLPMGMCGLIKRDTLEDVDIGFAFMPEFWGQGYAYEAAAAVMDYGKGVLELKRIVAITSLDNQASGRLLEKVGLRFERMIRLSENAEEVRLFVSET